MLEAGDLVLCTVDRIDKTTVFVRLIIDGKETDGSINFSEIAPGRIRNIRDYVVPKKKIVCKILRITPAGNIELSLRRVSQKEAKEVLSKEQQEKSYLSMVRSIVGNKAEEVIKNISSEENLYDFFQEAKENPKKLEKFFSKTEAQKIHDILKTQKQKKIIIKKEIELRSFKSDGVNIIKSILGEIKGYDVLYVGAGNYVLRKESDDIKTADKKLREILADVEKKSKKLGVELKIKN